MVGVISRVLVIGGTGMMGQHLVNASLAAGHPTALLIRPTTATDDDIIDHGASGGRTKLLQGFEARGAKMVYGDLNDHASLVAACKDADVGISAVGHHDEYLESGQLKILAAIKEAGGAVKRFVPSEYGCDVDQVDIEALIEPARSILLAKVDSPPETAATVFGDGSARGIFVHEDDMSALVMRAVEDPRILNKILYVRPPANIFSFGELVRLWKEKTGKSLDKYHMPTEELVRRIRESPFPLNFQLAMVHATVAPEARACDQQITAAVGVEATKLYPDFNFATVHEYLDNLVKNTYTL